MHLYIEDLVVSRRCGLGLIGSLTTRSSRRRPREILGISDPGGDPRLHYMGGAKPSGRQFVDSGKYAFAVAVQPVPVEKVLAIADNDGVAESPPGSSRNSSRGLSSTID